MPAFGARARFLCTVGERFGTPPHEVLRWPASTLRLLEADALMTKHAPKADAHG